MSIIHDYAAINKAVKDISPKALGEPPMQAAPPAERCLYSKGTCALEYCRNGQRCAFQELSSKKKASK